MDSWWDGFNIPDSVRTIGNPTGGTVTSGTLVLPPNLLGMDPEVEKSDITRWTAPSAGTWSISALFQGIDTSEHSHTVEVLENSTTMLLAPTTISSYGQTVNFSADVSLAKGATIDFIVNGATVYTDLSTGLSATLVKLGTVAINGPAAGVTISGDNASGVFLVDSGVTASMSGLTITGGKATYGGGIYNEGTLTLTGTTISGNSASSVGGGLYNSDGADPLAHKLHHQRQPCRQLRRGHVPARRRDHTDRLHHQRQLLRTQGRRSVRDRRHDHVDQLHRQRQHRLPGWRGHQQQPLKYDHTDELHHQRQFLLGLRRRPGHH